MNSARAASRILRAAVLVLLWPLALAACGGEPGEDAAGNREGVGRYATPPSVALPFSTVVPEGVIAQRLDVEGEAVRFIGSWGDERDERAFLHFAVAQEGTTEAGARETVNAVAESYRVIGDRSELQQLPPPPWAVRKFRVRGAGTDGDVVTGWVALGRHAGRWFHIIVQQPEPLEAEFSARVNLILDDWRWTDDGQPLRERSVSSDRAAN